MEGTGPTRDAVLEQLDRILASKAFQGAERSSTLLRFLVEHALDGRGDRLKEYTLGSEALGRGDAFDPRTDPIVRAEASRLRTRLERYYATDGASDRLVLDLPKGSYVPRFVPRGAAAPAPRPVVAPEGGTRSLAVGLAMGAAVAVLAFLLWGRLHPAPQPAAAGPLRFDVELRPNGRLGSVMGNDLVLSPDGTRMAFVAQGDDGVGRLNTRRLDRSAITELRGTEGARSPFFSPDGRWLGFWAGGKLKKLPIDGGSPVVLCDAPDLLGGSWGDDGVIVAALSVGRLSRVAASGGTPSVVADLSSEAITPVWPQVLPGGKYAIVTVIGGLGADQATIEAIALADGARRTLVRGGTFGRLLSNGAENYLTYVNQGTLFALAFDPDRLETVGEPVPLLDDVAYAGSGYAQLDFSRTGTLAYQRRAGTGDFSLAWLDRSGGIDPLPIKVGRYLSLRLSPDGQKVGLGAIESGVARVTIHDLRSHAETRINSAPYGQALAWTPDGRGLVLGGYTGLAWMPADGSRPPQALTHATTPQIPTSFTPDGSRLAYHAMSPTTALDLWTLPLRRIGESVTAETPQPFLRTPSVESYPTFSPDGRWVAYASNESGAWEVYVRAFPDGGTSYRVSDRGGRISAWSRTKRELLYRTDDQRLMVVTYDTPGSTFVPSAPRPWSTRQLGDTGVAHNFDLAPDGERVLALLTAEKPETRQSRNHVTFLLNVFDELRRRQASSAP